MLIKHIDRYATNIDIPDSPETIATEMRGLIPQSEGMIAERDFGTVHRYPTPPIRPNAHFNITDISLSGGTQFTTSAAHGFIVGTVIYIAETTIDGGMFNGKWVVSAVPTTTTFRVTGAPVVITEGTTTGIVSSTPVTIVGGKTFVDTDGTEYDIVVGLDSSANMRIFVYSSGWIELTRKFNALINDAPGADDATFDIDTITEHGVAFTFVNDIVNDWIVVNTTRANQTVFITDSSAANLVVDTVIGSNGLNWQNDDVLEIYRFPAIKFNYTYSNGASPSLRWMEVRDQRKINLLYTHTDGTTRQAIQIMKRDARNYFYDGVSAYLRTLAAGWYIESDFGIINPFYGNHGTVSTPETSATAVGGSMLTISSATNASPIEITTTTPHGRTTGDIAIITNVDTNTGANGIWIVTVTSPTKFTLNGSAGSGGAGSSGYAWVVFTKTSIYDKTGGRNWMNYFSSLTTYAAKTKYFRLYLTALLGYQESDPIFQGFYYNANGAAVATNIGINFALMNKELTELIPYGAYAPNDGVATSAEWIDTDGDYHKLLNRIMIQSFDATYDLYNWAARPSSINGCPYYRKEPLVINSGHVVDAIASGQTTLQDALNHEVDKDRSYPTPRFVTKVARPQGSISVIDEDDRTLRSSNRNGDNINEDDNYPNRTIDNEDSKLKIFLNSSGKLLGISVHNDQIHALKQTEREYMDLQSGTQGIKPCDFVAPESLVLSPHGLSWFGDKGAYLLQDGYDSEIMISESLQNLFDGTKKITGTTTSYVTASARRAVKSEYISAIDALAFVIVLNKSGGGTETVTFVYSFKKRPLSGKAIEWYQRKFNIGSDGSIAYFASRPSDDSLTIGYASGILKYPNQEGSYLYQDDVLISGASTQYSQDKGIPTKLKIMLGSLYSLTKKAIVDLIKIDYDGASISGAGTFNILIWINKMTTAIETKTQPIDSIMDYRGIPPIGGNERTEIEINLTEGAEEDIKKFDISTIDLSTYQDQITGNR